MSYQLTGKALGYPEDEPIQNGHSGGLWVHSVLVMWEQLYTCECTHVDAMGAVMYVGCFKWQHQDS